jgi:hypothetical protein
LNKHLTKNRHEIGERIEKPTKFVGYLFGMRSTKQARRFFSKRQPTARSIRYLA